MEEASKKLWKSLAEYVRALDLKSGHYQFHTFILQTGEDKDISMFKSYLVPVTEKDIYGDIEKEREINHKCFTSVDRRQKC